MKFNIKVILATDCGSTTTKAILIEWKDNRYRLTFRGEAPTTVEAPFEDVTKGVLNSIIELEELSNRKIFSKNFFIITTTTMLIITVVKSSLALSLGLVGALSIIRFRAAIKEPEELGYLFLTISIGLGCGAD